MLVSDVEVVGRLIEQQGGRFLSEAARDGHPLAFTAGELIEAPINEAESAYPFEGFGGHASDAARRELFEVLAMGDAAQENEVRHRHRNNR